MRPCILGFFACLIATPLAWGDRIIFFKGQPAEGVIVEKASYEVVEYKFPGTTALQKRSADEVVEILWEQERASVAVGRRHLEVGDFEAAARQLEAAKSLSGRDGANAGFLLGLA